MSAGSEAAFVLILAASGLSEATQERFRAKKVLTQETLALKSTGTPGQPAGDDFTASVLVPLAGAADNEDAIIIKKLYVEAHAQLISELRLRLEGGKNKHVLPEPEQAQ
eukprot:3539119-Amphidinium_carterae.1